MKWLTIFYGALGRRYVKDICKETSLFIRKLKTNIATPDELSGINLVNNYPSWIRSFILYRDEHQFIRLHVKAFSATLDTE